MQTLSAQLKTVKGKKSYGYLPKSVKKTVDEVVDKLEELPEVRECYEQWCALQSEVDSYYHDKPREKKNTVPGERVPADQERRHPGGGAYPSGGNRFRGCEPGRPRRGGVGAW